MGCLNCGKELVHTPGKKPKKFCNNSCRSGYGQRKKKGQADVPKKGPGRPKKVNAILRQVARDVKFIEPMKIDEKLANYQPPSTEIIQSGGLGTVTFGSGNIQEITKVVTDNKKGSVTLTIGAKKLPSNHTEDIDAEITTHKKELQYPSNWAEMGRLDKLKWLTANNK